MKMCKSLPYVDVVIPTWNSNAFYFPVVVRRIIAVLEPHHLVVVDRFSRDGTQEVLKKYASDVLKLVEIGADLAYARKIGGMLADSEVVCYVDDDVVIPKCFKLLVKRIILSFLMNRRVGVIAFSICKGIPKAEECFRIRVSRVIKPLRSLSVSNVLKRGIHVYSRGYTFFFCVKRELIKSWNPPPDLSAYEDYHLSQHILSKGYLWVEFSSPCVIHMKDMRYRGLHRYFKQGLWEGSNVMRAGISLKYVILHIIGRLIGAMHKRNLNQFLTYIGYIVGLLVQWKFKSWRR